MSKERTRILIVDDEEIVRESLSAWLEQDGYTLAVAPDGETGLERIRKERWSILLVDLKMPGIDGLQVLEEARKIQPEAAAVIMTAYTTVDTAVSAMKLGAYDYLVKPFDPEELSLMIQKIVTQQALVRENVLLRKVLKRRVPLPRPDQQEPRDAGRLRPGENRGAHQLDDPDPRRERHGQGARGARHPRREPAQPGTVRRHVLRGAHRDPARDRAVRPREGRLHRRGDAPQGQVRDGRGRHALPRRDRRHRPKLQLKLLRVLEERKFTRVGGNDAVAVDVRIIAATNRDLQKAVADGAFREDLFYRLNVIPVHLPPLRERLEDMPLLVEHFLEHLGAEMNRRVDEVSSEALALLMAHHWPGNVRELRNVIERAMVVATGRVIEAGDLGLRRPGDVTENGALASLDDVEKHHIARVLGETGGNISQAARTLGIDRATLYNKMRKYQLRKDGEPDADPDQEHETT